VFLLTSSALGSVDRAVEEAAESLGAGPLRRLWRVTLPLVLPSLSAGALLAFMMALANFGTPVVLDPGTRVLPTLAYQRFTSEVSSDLGIPSALCVVLVALSTAALLLQRWAASRRRVSADLLRRTRPRELPSARRWAAAAVCHGIVLLSTLPLGVVVWTSLRRTDGPVFHPGLSLDSYRQVLYGVRLAISNSFAYSVIAALGIALVGAALGYVVARRRDPLARALDPLLMIPYVVPGVAIGVAYALAWNDGPLVLTGTGAILILSAFIRHLPYTVRSSAAILQQVDPALEQAAVSLGASPARAFTDVTLPLMGPGLLSGTVLAWVTATGELSAALVLYVGDTVTMPVKVYLQVIDGSLGPAAALSTILLVATALPLWATLRALDGRAEALAA
jgi:iron(III) transport system permease protein